MVKTLEQLLDNYSFDDFDYTIKLAAESLVKFSQIARECHDKESFLQRAAYMDASRCFADLLLKSGFREIVKATERFFGLKYDGYFYKKLINKRNRCSVYYVSAGGGKVIFYQNGEEKSMTTKEFWEKYS